MVTEGDSVEIKGLTGAGVLLVALLGGAAGGALVSGGHDTAPPAVVFDQAAQATSKPNQAKRAEAAAKRAEKAAKRAEAAAGRAETAAKQETVPVSTPAPTPAPYMPGPGTKPGEACPGYEGNGIKVGDGPWLKCRDGVWQVDESKAEPEVPEPTPAP